MEVKSIEKKEKNSAEITVSVSPEEFEAALVKVFNKNRKSIQIPGFRKGKAPRKIVEAMYGESVFYEDAINEVAPDAYFYSVKEKELKVVANPSIEDAKVEDDKSLTLKFNAVLYPEVELGQYKGLEAVRKAVKVDPAEIDMEVDQLRERNATVQTAERPAKFGDTVVIDYEGFIDGVPFEGGKDTGHKLKLGSGSFIPGFEDQLIGRSAGDKLDVSVTFPEDYHAKDLAGKPAVFKVKIHSLTYEELPELDDDFAVEVSEFNTFAEYRADVAAKIGKSREDAADRDLTEKLDARLSDLLTGEVPEAMTDNEVDSMVRDTESRISMNGLDFKTYLQYFGMTVDQYKENARPAARTRVRSRLALEKIAELEQIEISQEDTDKEYADIASQYNMETDKVRESIPAEDVVDTLKLRRAMEIVKAAARVTYLDKEPEPEEGSADAQTADSADQK